MTALASERDRIQRFFGDVLGCQVTKKPEADIIRLGNNFYLGVVYEDSALSESDLLKSIWLELRTDRPEELKQNILKFGIKEIEYRDKEHFYFQAPGGQVFRLAGNTEDMSKWQRCGGCKIFAVWFEIGLDGPGSSAWSKKMSAAVPLKRYKIRSNKPRRNYHEPICLSLSRCRAREIP